MGNVEEVRSEVKVRSFQDLDCWKKCRELRMFVFELTKKFPKDELYGLTQNMRRAAYSTTENMAEGYGRFRFQENIQFCRHSRGSLYEIWDQMITASDNNYVSANEMTKAEQIINEALRILNGYINFLKREQERNLSNRKPFTE